MEKIIKTIFSPRCSLCGSFGVGLCRNCLSKCQVFPFDTCIGCDKPSINGVTHSSCLLKNSFLPKKLFCAFDYKQTVRDVIRVSKYNQKEFYALKKLTSAACTYASKCGNDFSDHLVISIPLSKQKAKERGFNQSDVIAKQLASEFKLDFNLKALVRVKTTIPQANLSRASRIENLENAFEIIDQTSIKNRKILLVDDVTTTGSTFNSASAKLLSLGALEVNCFALSKKVL